MAAGITTHVLDVSTGKPAAGMQIELFDTTTQPPTLIARTRTNRDGRTDAPILPAAQARAGSFELRFLGRRLLSHAGCLRRCRSRALHRLGRDTALPCAAALFAMELRDLSRELNMDRGKHIHL